MSKTPFSKKVEILSDVWVWYLQDRDMWSGWNYFFQDVGVISLPLCYSLHNQLAFANDDSITKDMVDETFAILCDLIQIDRAGNYDSAEHMFESSPLGKDDA